MPGVSGWILAGGEGRRMQGHDKGLIALRGRPLAAWVIQALAPQVSRLDISANRYLGDYRAMLQRYGNPTEGARPDIGQVRADDPDLPLRSGPLAGILTGLRHTATDWLMIAPCDSPDLPGDLVTRLHQAALSQGVDIAVPTTYMPDGQTRHHWVTALIGKRVCPQLEGAFVKGDRKVGVWIQSCRWTSVSFADHTAFANINTMETLHGRRD